MGELHHYYYPYSGSYFQGNLLLPLPQIYKMLSNLLLVKKLHPFYFVPTLFTDPPFLVKKMSTPTLLPIFKSMDCQQWYVECMNYDLGFHGSIDTHSVFIRARFSDALNQMTNSST